MPETARDLATGARGAGAVWFTPAIAPASTQGRPLTAPVFMLTFAIDTTSAVEISLDNGATFVALRDETGATAFTANTNYTRPILVRNIDLFNVRAVAGVTIVYARLDEWS